VCDPTTAAVLCAIRPQDKRRNAESARAVRRGPGGASDASTPDDHEPKEMAKKLLALFGLKFNPFSNDVPVESLHRTARLDEFVWRIQHQVGEGGFALVSGEAGTGKSASLRVLAGELSELRDVSVGVLTRPHASVADFYRELGHVFAVPLTPHNRWAGAKALREKWIAHIGNAGVRPVLLLDEAQETRTSVLNELRLLSSTELDAQSILTVVLAGDAGRARRGQLPRAHDDGRRALARRGAARARATRPGPLHRPVPARAAAREEAEADMSGLPTTLASELGDGDAEPKWLIDGLWSDAAVGVLGGEPKCCKSFLALDAGPALRVIGDDAASDDEAGGRGPADRILAVLSDADRPLRRSEPKKRCAMRAATFSDELRALVAAGTVARTREGRYRIGDDGRAPVPVPAL
jgi:type II secretory pathway predicted ATPase ExeA